MLWPLPLLGEYHSDSAVKELEREEEEAIELEANSEVRGEFHLF